MSELLSAFGISTVLPPGWEGRVMQRQAPAPATQPGPGAGLRGWPGERPHPVFHLANFALPAERGDFGTGAVERMRGDDLLVVLFEYGSESVGTALFSPRGLPRKLHPSMFSPDALQVRLAHQAGLQRFFTEADRAFSLYVVLGSRARATSLVPQANRTLAATRISPR